MRTPTLYALFAMFGLAGAAFAQTDYGSNREAGAYLLVNGVNINMRPMAVANRL